ncbi:hypothetical protein NPS70_12500 [Streptomyces sp. C10-9-1]|uniref:hypothetical protein n=1 Tax=Streptomyces sp. C10-9-1 TaxID=1859285 RepID=UPI002113603A|nr:hypothetical protein [Streptomyces sp. C10-9-1]MCQ6554012.1 hypothetical protein [Streptomyces sp. C10-9-1]
MTNDDRTSVPASGPDDAPAADAAAGPASGAATPSGRRRKALTVLPAVGVLAAVGAGLVFTGVTVRGADTHVPTTIWAASGDDGSTDEGSEDPAASAHRGRTDNELSKLLLPVPGGYGLGPDLEGSGNDVLLTRQEAGAQLKASLDGLYGRERREAERRIDALGLQGLASRSYLKDSHDLVVQVSVGQMTDRNAARDWYREELAWYEEAGVPEGPEVRDHENASCVLPQGNGTDPDDREPYLGLMRCVAYEGEYFVSLTAYGSAPFPRLAAARLMKDQLDHIASPGEYV